MVELQKYKGSTSRHTCPACNTKNSFVRYVDDSGEYISPEVGKCNRESKCGYHYKPKEFFRDNPKTKKSKNKSAIAVAHTSVISKSINSVFENDKAAFLQGKKPFDVIPTKYLTETLGNYNSNAFVQFLLNLFPDDIEAVWQTVHKYFIGTFHGKTLFWQIDQRRRVRTGKIMLYNEKTGKRMAETFINRNGEEIEIKANWMHAKLKKQGKLSEDFNLRQCFFGEHLLQIETGKPIAIVEAEKTAIIASICLPESTWLACGGKQNLNVESLKRLGQRKIILYPDGDGFAEWQERERKAQMQNLDVRISALIEIRAADHQKTEGYDLADYLIGEQKAINQYNLFVDLYNSKLDKVRNDEKLYQDFEAILDEQIAILMIDGEISETEANTRLLNSENFRLIVMSL